MLFGLLALVAQATAYTITVKNECSQDIWPAIYKFEDSSPLPDQTGSKVSEGGSWDVSVPTEFKGRMWMRTGCDESASSCASGTAPGGLHVEGISWTDSLTVFELGYSSFNYGGSNLQQTVVDIGNQGFNVPMKIEPVDDTLGGTCTSFECTHDGCSGAFQSDTDYAKEHHCSLSADYIVTLCP